jgi:hypothetical protein
MYSSVCNGQVPYGNDAKNNDVHRNSDLLNSVVL